MILSQDASTELVRVILFELIIWVNINFWYCRDYVMFSDTFVLKSRCAWDEPCIVYNNKPFSVSRCNLAWYDLWMYCKTKVTLKFFLSSKIKIGRLYWKTEVQRYGTWREYCCSSLIIHKRPVCSLWTYSCVLENVTYLLLSIRVGFCDDTKSTTHLCFCPYLRKETFIHQSSTNKEGSRSTTARIIIKTTFKTNQ